MKQLYIKEVTSSFADAGLIGIPVRLVVSKKAGKGKVEWKERNKEKVEVLTVDQSENRLRP